MPAPDSSWIIGAAAGTLTTLSFVPQVMKSWRRRSVSDLSAGMLLAFATGVVLWIVHGLRTNDVALVAANLVTLLLAIALLAMKWRFR